MLGFLFRRLTAERQERVASFELATELSRQPHWYVEGKVPDTLDGRFAVLATITAILIVRLEAESETGIAASVRLTERFIHVMESEHRELGLGDPSLGKTVRKLVGLLAHRTEVWRQAQSGGKDWAEAVRESLYRAGVDSDALRHSTESLRSLNKRLFATSVEALEQGQIS